MQSLASLVQKGPVIKPPRMLIYGTGGVGKTTFAAQAPAPILIPTEDGADVIGCDRFPKAGSVEDVQNALRLLWTEAHEYQTVIIDSMDALEPLVWEHTCAAESKRSIEDFGFGKGYIKALDTWRLLQQGLDHLRNKVGMAVVLIAHHEVKRYDDPTSEGYDRYQPRLQKAASALWVEWADLVGFANYEQILRKDGGDKSDEKRRIGISSGKRKLYVEGRPAFVAKNRYSLPPELPLDFSAVAEGIGAAVPNTTNNAAE